jgi:aldehyde dehydrogenase (NAD+)
MTDTVPPTLATGDVTDLGDLLDRLRAAQASGRTRSATWRVTQLHALRRLVDDNEARIAQALADDLGRTPTDAWLGDIVSTTGEIDYALKRVRWWMRKRLRPLPLNQQPAVGWVQYEPLGVVLVVGPWNYPFYLALSPLVAALAAGNCAVIKPSELAPATSALIAELVPRYLDTSAVAVVEGDGATTQTLLSLGFDHALFTGGTEVGRKIMAGAAPTLTPVTLELGGKSPVYVAADADLDVAARRVAWVKLLNSGQTCIAPDYVLVDRAVRDELVHKVSDTLRAFRGTDHDRGMPIVNDRQFERLAGYLRSTRGLIVHGGLSDASERTIRPTVIVDPDPTDPVMTDEIFGPILPVLAVDSLDEAIDFVKARPKPLALYAFTSSRHTRRRLADEVLAGGVVFNHIAMHVLVPQLPFGGVGESGMGAYHGEWGFQALSHRKAVLSKTTRPDPRFVYPPYTEKALTLMRRIF